MKADQTIKVYLLWQVLTSFVHNILKKWKEASKHFSFQLTTCPWKKKSNMWAYIELFSFLTFIFLTLLLVKIYLIDLQCC